MIHHHIQTLQMNTSIPQLPHDTDILISKHKSAIFCDFMIVLKNVRDFTCDFGNVS